MKLRKWSAFLGLVLTVVFLSSCYEMTDLSFEVVKTVQKTQNQIFDEIIEAEFFEYISSDALTTHFLLENPEDYGLEDYEITWGTMQYPSEEEIAKMRKRIEAFEKFDRKSLNEERQKSYDLFAWQAALFEKSLELFYYAEPLSPQGGQHVSLPLALNQYSFSDKQDIENYLVLLEKGGEFFDEIISFEKEKAARGLFMADSFADSVIESCKNVISKKNDNLLITGFTEKMNRVAFLKDEEKNTFESKNKNAFNNVIVKGYERLIKELAALKGQGKNHGGLSGFEKGREYYELELKRLGSSKTAGEWIKTCDSEMKKIIRDITALTVSKPEVLTDYTKTYSSEMTAEETIKFFIEKAGYDFPLLPQNVKFTVREIDESLRSSVAPAMYFVPKLDSYENNSIYVNPDYLGVSRDTMVMTLAHEGYPGHMLQKVNLMNSKINNYRKVISFGGYHEGWAQYVQGYSAKYVIDDEPVRDFLNLNQDFNYLLSFRVDLGVNYEGWGMPELKTYISETLMSNAELSDEELKAVYDDAVSGPLRIAAYAFGKYEVEELAKHYKRALGTLYSDKLFHVEFLRRGEAPFSILKDWMDEALLGTSEITTNLAA